MIKTTLISSKSNSNLKRWLSLLESQGIKKHKQFLIFGEKAVNETLESFPDQAIELITASKLQLPRKSSLPIFECGKSLFNEIDIFHTNSPILVARTFDIPPMDLNTPAKKLEIVCPFGDPRNLGSLIRSAHSFGISKIILLQDAANPFLPQSVRAASGSLFHVNFFKGPRLKDLSAFTQTPQFYALDFGGANINKFVWPLDLRLVLGEEGPGLSETKFSNLITIPLKKTANSLNAATAAAIALFSYRAQHALLD